MRVCDTVRLSCDYCFSIETECGSGINVQAGLTPVSTPYLWITDKFNNQYRDQVTINGDGSFNIDLSNYPMGLFNPASGWFDLFLSSDIDGQILVPFNFGSSYNCVKLRIPPVAATEFLLQDDENYILQDDGFKIIYSD